MTNTRQGYGWISIALHWAAAISILVLYLNGEAIEDAVGRDAHFSAVMAHVSLGMALFVVLAARVVWSVASKKPDAFPQHPALRALSVLIHWLLLLAIVVAIVTGPLAIWSVGRPLSLYGLSIPSPWATPDRGLHEMMEEVHELAAKSFIPLVALHVLGALKHFFVDKDRTLQRMLWVKRTRG
jgi:cytochrome b561